MSTLSVTNINSPTGTTDLTLLTGNAAAGDIVLLSGGGLVLAANSTQNTVVINTSVVSVSSNLSVNDNVGVGTSSPAQKMHVVSNSSVFMRLDPQNAGRAAQLEITRGTGNNSYIGLGADNTMGLFSSEVIPIVFTNNNYTERMRIDVSGNVGIGTASPGARLDVNGGIRDNKGDVRSVPQNAQTSAYTLVAADNGRHISITTGGVTVPAGVFAAGDTVTIYNNSASNQTITQGASVTLRQVATANTGNRTLAQRGLATILCVGSNEFVITGGGLS